MKAVLIMLSNQRVFNLIEQSKNIDFVTVANMCMSVPQLRRSTVLLQYGTAAVRLRYGTQFIRKDVSVQLGYGTVAVAVRYAIHMEGWLGIATKSIFYFISAELCLRPPKMFVYPIKDLKFENKVLKSLIYLA